jgi:hypothetical protein
MKLTKVNSDYIFEGSFGRVVFPHQERCVYAIILDFKERSGADALQLCRDAIDFMFSKTDCLIIYGYIEKNNAASRSFGTALGFSVEDGQKASDYITRKMTIARWLRLHASRDLKQIKARKPERFK